jgi:hypothetical protein
MEIPAYMRGHMRSSRSTIAWVAYTLVYVNGCAALMYLSRRPRPLWSSQWWPFLFPMVLAAMAAVACRAQASEAPRGASDSVSLSGRRTGDFQRGPTRATTLIALTMLTAPLVWISPAGNGLPSLGFVFLGWWLACTAFVAFVLPVLSAPSLKA